MQIVTIWRHSIGGRVWAALLLPLAIFAAAPCAAARFDLVIAGGRVVDPASNRDEVTNIGIKDGHIEKISKQPLNSVHVLDAKGMIVAPGFIDLHAHGQDPKAEYYQLLDGVTTSIDMEAGRMPITKFYASMNGHALINFGASASFMCARLMVLSATHCTEASGSAEQNTLDIAAMNVATTPEQEQREVALMDAELAAGALGYGLPMEYVPAMGRRETFRIFQDAARTHAPIEVHVRMRQPDRAPGVPIAVAQEVIADAAATGAGLQIAHVPSTALGDTSTVLELAHGARRQGVDITLEMYPYTAGSTAIGSNFFSEGWQKRNGISYGDVLWPATGERLTQESFERYRKEQPSATVVVSLMSEQVVEQAMADPMVSIASDGKPWVTAGEHPRGAGTFSRVLGLYVREKHTLDLKTAIAKMTIMPARRLEAISPQMAHKGRLSVGADADVTVFDPLRIRDAATFEKPMQASVGIRYVLVSGKVMATDGKVTGNLFPGVAVRSAIGH